MTTPEGRIKRKVSELLDKYETYRFMPVQSGFGSVTLDYLVCVGGKFLAIETKAPGGKPTERQLTTMENISKAGGVCMTIDGPIGLERLEKYLDANTRKR